MTEEVRTFRMALRDWVIRMGGDYDAMTRDKGEGE